MARPQFDVVICGNGASAALLVQALARQTGQRLSVLVVGRSGSLGEGIAYSTRNPLHLLNVPAERLAFGNSGAMTFTGWLRDNGRKTDGWSDQFVPRSLFGEFLRDEVEETLHQADNLKLTIRTSEIVGLVKQETGWTVIFNTGSVFSKLVVLATGNDMPAPISGNYGPAIASAITDNPWTEFEVDPKDRILLVGSALTAVDVLFALAAKNHAGQITLLSRHGLLPYTHVQPSQAAPLPHPYPKNIVGLLRALRQAAGRTPEPQHWQGLMDAMRPYWSEIWQGLTQAEQRRFLRHGATLWNLHRHRIAPAAAARLSSLVDRRARVVRGRLGNLARNADGSVTAQIRGRSGVGEIQVDRIINCSGPNVDPEKTNDRLLENIIASRQARVSPCGIGLDVDGDNRVVSKDGEIQRTLLAIGALTRGRWWEITAVPEIAQQAQEIAKSIRSQLLTLRDAKGNLLQQDWV